MKTKKKLLSLHIDTGSYGSFVDRIVALGRERRSSYVCVANVHMVVEAHRDQTFAAVVNAADLVTPDGVPVAKALRLLHGLNQERVSGMDLLPDLFAAAERELLSVFLYGSTAEVLDRMLQRIAAEHPGLPVAGAHSPPFRALSAAEELSEVARINASGAHLLLVALGCPKQERWMASQRGRVKAVMVGLGGAFPVYAGVQRRAPVMMQRLALEWFYRLCQEPRRLFTRYFVTNNLFLMLLARELGSVVLRHSRGQGEGNAARLDDVFPPP